ncbi:MAG TPA: nucleoside triphosphate pyrophosphohydrolase [Gaiellaceae bacterium]|nr:nucleoside triphosphate pyrophosphohydrolase [Gaiellaceae bacterium]
MPEGREALAGALVDLQELTERLRRECPWDREQTAETIVPHTIEEAYEVADAALAGEDVKLVDELGDLLFQTFFLALLLEERGAGDLAQVALAIQEKLVRRHPHVFGEGAADTPGAVRKRWEELKSEQEGREGIFHHVPETLPSLLYAQKVQRRAAAVGFEYADLPGAFGDLDDEVEELRAEPSGAELGDVLFAAVNVARHLGVDPELELRQASGRFVERVERAEELAAADGKEFGQLELAEQDRYYDLAKAGR